MSKFLHTISIPSFSSETFLPRLREKGFSRNRVRSVVEYKQKNPQVQSNLCAFDIYHFYGIGHRFD